MSNWNPENYDRAWKTMAETGKDPHGEVAFIERAIARHGVQLAAPILDAGCGTGRVAIELARRGYDVHGTDVDEVMLAHAREKAPSLPWTLGNLASLSLPSTYSVVAMAGNVILFVDPADRGRVLPNLTAHLGPGGLVIAGFQLQRTDGRRVPVSDWDTWADGAGLDLVERFATWDEDPFSPAGDYVVNVHRKLR